MSDPKRGMLDKYTVTRTDGSSAPGRKHHGCRVFVLDLDHDVFARDALATYARAARAGGYTPLANDLERWGTLSPVTTPPCLYIGNQKQLAWEPHGVLRLQDENLPEFLSQENVAVDGPLVFDGIITHWDAMTATQRRQFPDAEDEEGEYWIGRLRVATESELLAFFRGPQSAPGLVPDAA